jgi:lysophospholipase L1-like esterase
MASSVVYQRVPKGDSSGFYCFKSRLHVAVCAGVATTALAFVYFSYESRSTALCIGDSLTAGFWRHSFGSGPSFDPYSSSLAANLGIRAIALGWSGWTSTQLLEAADLWVVPPHARSSSAQPGIHLAISRWHPDFVIIMAGTNDVRKTSVDGKEIAWQIWALHEIAHSANSRTVALSIPEWRLQEIPGKPGEAERLVERRSALNAELKRLAEASSMTTYLDFPLPYEEETGFWSKLDGLHFTKRGSKEVGRLLALALKPHLSSLLRSPLSS